MGDVITRFKLETAQYDSKLRDATDRMKELMRSVQVAGGSLNDLSAKDKELARSFGTLSTGANNAKDKVRELASDLNRVGRAYFTMTKEMQQSDVGKAIAEQMRVMKERLTEAKKELYDMGGAEQSAAAGGLDLNAVMESLASQFGINTKLLSSLTSGTVATTAAVTAGAAAVAMATKAWVDYNDEIDRQNNVTTVTTGLKGDDAEALTMGVRALSRTYDVDFRDAINAANTLMQQFGVTGEQALSLLQDGMQGMIAGDGGKLLSMIQQYAPSFRDAGIEASQLVAIIQNSEGGIFTDQNMSAITMGIKNIRLMTKQTSDALAQLGIDGAEMTRKMNDGSMTIFEAMQQVSEAIENVGSSSQAVGQVMQNVFGRQGTMAGTKLGEAIATLNTNLQETKKQTGELGESFVRLNEANLRLERTMQEIFGMSGWEDMSNTIKTQFTESISDALQYLIDVRDALKDIGSYESFDTLSEAAFRFMPALYPILQGLQEMKGLLNDIESAWNGLTGNIPEPPKAQQQTNQQKPVQNGYQVTTDKNGTVVSTTRIVNGQKVDEPKQTNQQTNQRTYEQVKADLDRAKKELENAKDAISRGTAKSLVDYYEQELKRLPKPEVKQETKTTTTTNTITTNKNVWAPIEMKPVEAVEIKGRSVNDVNADLSKAKSDYNAAGDEFGRAAAQAMIDKYQAELTAIKNESTPFADAYKYDFGKEADKIKSDADNNNNNGKGNENLRKELEKAAKTASSIEGGIESIAGGLEGLGAELPAELKNIFGGVQSMISIMSGISTILLTIEALSQVQTATSAIPFFSGGGIVKAANGYTVPGNFGYDAVPSLLTSGEVVLNRAQQGNIVSQMMDSRMNGGAASAPSYVRGEDIWLGVNNFLKRSGRGEIVTSRK